MEELNPTETATGGAPTDTTAAPAPAEPVTTPTAPTPDAPAEGGDTGGGAGTVAPTDPTDPTTTESGGESLLQKAEHFAEGVVKEVETVVGEVVHAAEELVDSITGHESAEAGTPGESQEAGGEAAAPQG